MAEEIADEKVKFHRLKTEVLIFSFEFLIQDICEKLCVMGIIRLPLLYRGTKNDKYVYSLFDSGANYSFLRKDIAEQLEDLTLLRKPLRMATADPSNFLEVNYATRTFFNMSNDVELSDEFYVLDDLSEEAVIGALTMQKWKMKLDFEHDRVEVDPRMTKMQIIQIK
ncbi:MAG: retropepsin-like aspartic protease [Chitinophagaceae bacterium]